MTKDEHEQALKKIEALIDIDPAESSPEAKELEALAIEVERYEEEHFPIGSPTPKEMADFRADQMNLGQPKTGPEPKPEVAQELDQAIADCRAGRNMSGPFKTVDEVMAALEKDDD